MPWLRWFADLLALLLCVSCLVIGGDTYHSRYGWAQTTFPTFFHVTIGEKSDVPQFALYGRWLFGWALAWLVVCITCREPANNTHLMKMIAWLLSSHLLYVLALLSYPCYVFQGFV